jgi:branched-chain amino acid transport system ATP-binding protein/branched-chain amino acid transport system permease protein
MTRSVRQHARDATSRLRWIVAPTIGASALAAVLVAVAAYAWLDDSRAAQERVVYFFVNLIIVLALQTFSGNSGMMSFGHMAFVGVGAYVASILTVDPTLKQQELQGLPSFLASSQLSLLPAAAVAAGAAAILAVLYGLLLFRLSEASAIIGIFSLLLIANAIFGGWTSVTGGGGGIYGMPRDTTVEVTLVVAVICLFVARYFRDSGMGIKLRASREEPAAAAAVGVKIFNLRLVAWVVSAAMAGLAGALLALRLTAIDPSAFYLSPTFLVVAMVVIGGMTTVGGAVAGTLIVTLVRELSLQVESNSISLGPIHFSRLTGLSQILLVLMILMTMYFRREGLAGRLEIDEFIQRRLIRRRRESGDLAAPDSQESHRDPTPSSAGDPSVR